MNQLQQAVFVGKADVRPHGGVAGSDAGKVLKARGGKFQIFLPVGVVEKLVDIGEGGKVGHMGDGSENRVVALRVHRENVRTDRAPQVFYQCNAV